MKQIRVMITEYMITKSSKDFLEFCTEILSNFGVVTYKRMFSGYSLYLNNQHCASIVDNTLFLVVPYETFQDELKSLGSCQFSYNKKDGKEIIIHNWWSVPAELLEEPILLEKYLLVPRET